MNILQDLLGLFKRKKFATPKGKDMIPIGVDKSNTAIGEPDAIEMKLVRVSDLAAFIGGGSSYGDTDVASYLNSNLNTAIIPDTNSTYDLGSAEYKFRDLYLSSNTIYLGDATISSEGNVIKTQELQTGDLHLSNINKSANSVDGTRGSWTFQEGDENLFLINNTSGKKYKFNLIEV